MTKTIGHLKDTKFCEDLDIIVRGLPGKGAALQRMFDRAGVIHQAVADHVGCDRAAVSYWTSGNKWPKAQRLLDVLVFLNIDRSMLAEASAILFGGDTARELVGAVQRSSSALSSFSVTKETLIEILKDQTDFDQRELIFKTLVPQATLALGLRAAGLKGGESCDPKAAKILFDEWREHRREAEVRNSRPPSSRVSASVQRVIETSMAGSAPSDLDTAPDQSESPN